MGLKVDQTSGPRVYSALIRLVMEPTLDDGAGLPLVTAEVMTVRVCAGVVGEGRKERRNVRNADLDMRTMELEEEEWGDVHAAGAENPAGR